MYPFKKGNFRGNFRRSALQQVKNWQLGFVPSFFTVLALTLGVHAIRFLFLGNVLKAIVCMLIAAFLDGLDGKVARLLNASSKFGSTLDTLADFLNFGIVPGFIVYIQYFHTSSIKLCWISIVAYIACLALRLARFSILGMEDGYYFRGVPAPGAAFLAMFPICVEYGFPEFADQATLMWIAAFCMLMMSFLMLSNFRTISLSRVKIPKQYFSMFIVILCMSISLFHMYPWHFIIFLQMIYLYSIFRKSKQLKQ